ncbi:hypothetical protein [Gimesia sp.]|uniref:hypothetical protein n=1 Tax=Gimesia sp. TaxID=2024833 RepID=UPI0032EB37C2
MPENPRTRKRRYLIYALPFLQLGYLLSIEPVEALMKTPAGDFKSGMLPLFQLIYAPVIVASMEYRWVNTLLQEYDAFWEQLL